MQWVIEWRKSGVKACKVFSGNSLVFILFLGMYIAYDTLVFNIVDNIF